MAAAGLRIVGGRWGSRRIAAPPLGITRPMPDRIKEAVFDVLGSWLGTPGRLPPLEVLDLFAGSGSLGLEAVSRGAAGCVFVERHAQAVGVLRDNLGALQAEPGLRVEVADVWACPAARLRHNRSPFGLVFLDPPYRDARDSAPAGRVCGLLNRIMMGGLLAEEVVVVLHHERTVRYEPSPGAAWVVARRREYGTTAISYLTRGDSPPGPGPAAERQA